MKILCFGSCGIDYSYWVPRYVQQGEEMTATRFERLPGGRGLKQAQSIAQSGEAVYFAGCIGKDGLFLKTFLDGVGVNTDYLKICDAGQSHAVKQRYGNNEYSLIAYGETNRQIDAEYIDSVLSHFDKSDIILLQNEINNIELIMEKAHGKGMRVILNPSPFEENLTKIDLGKADILILNEREAQQMTGLSDVRDICEYFKSKHGHLRVVITLGVIGGIYFDSRTELHFPAYSEALEATGSSGDTFIGYFVSGIKKGFTIERTLKRASCASALVALSRRNNMPPAVPTAEEVERAVSELKPNRKGTFETEKRRQLVLGYIENNYADPSLDALAEKLGYSKSYTTLWIKKHMSTSFSELLKDKRCEKAADMLRNTEVSIESIIRQTGCENGSFFRKIFKEKYGKAPLEYRNSVQGR